MKKILYIILFICCTGSFHSCTDYLNVDKYFYDQLTLDSAFSKRIYVEGWLATTFDVMGRAGEFYEPFRWASDDLYHPDMINYVEGNYSSSNQLWDGSEIEGRIWRMYEGVRRASTFIENVGNCPELTMSEISDMKAQARFLRAYSYWGLIRALGPVPFIPIEGLDVNLSYEELSLPREHIDFIVDFIDKELAEAARSLPATRTTNNMGHPTRGAALALRARAAAAAKDVIDLGLYSLYITPPAVNVSEYERPPYHSEYSDKNFPEGWANVDPLRSYKSIFDGTILGSKNPELIFTRTEVGTSTIGDWVYRSMPRTLFGDNRLAVTLKQVNAYYMDNGQTIDEAKSTGYYQTEGFTTSANSKDNPFLPDNVSLMYNRREPRFYASIAYNGSVWKAESAAESNFRDQQIFYYRGLNDGKQGFKEDCPITGISLKKYYNDEDARSQGGYTVNKTEPTIRYAEVLLIYAEALNELKEGAVHRVFNYLGEEISIQRDWKEMQRAMKQIRMRAGVPDFTVETYQNQTDFRVKLKRERQIELLGENAMRYFDLRRWKDALVEENQLMQGCNINISNAETHIQDFYKPTIITSVHKYFEQRMYLWPFPSYELKRNVNLTQNPGW